MPIRQIPPLPSRVAAHFIDIVLLAIFLATVWGLWQVFVAGLLPETFYDHDRLLILLLPLTIVAEALLLSAAGKTPGKWVKDIELAGKNGQRVPRWRAALRSTIKYSLASAAVVSGAVAGLYLGYFLYDIPGCEHTFLYEKDGLNVYDAVPYSCGGGFSIFFYVLLSIAVMVSLAYSAVIAIPVALRRDRRTIHDIVAGVYPVRS